MENITNNNVLSSEAGLVTSSSINPMQLEFAFEEQPWQVPPLPVINDYENYLWSNSSNMMRIFDDEQSSSSVDPSSWMPKLTPSYDQTGLLDNQLQPIFPDLWS